MIYHICHCHGRKKRKERKPNSLILLAGTVCISCQFLKAGTFLLAKSPIRGRLAWESVQPPLLGSTQLLSDPGCGISRTQLVTDAIKTPYKIPKSESTKEVIV